MNMDEFVANIWNAEFHAATGGCKEDVKEYGWRHLNWVVAQPD
jgi:hypothetical protein